MEAARVKRVVLELLVTRSDLGSANAWRQALSGELSPLDERDATVDGKSVVTSSVPLVLDAVEQTVPHLADYKTFYENVSGMLEFCEQECSHELLDVVCKWLSGSDSKTPMAVDFRRWLYEYMECACQEMLEVDARKYKHALLLAALKEEDAKLKLKLLQLIDRKIGTVAGIVASPQQSVSQAMRLSVFYWQNARQLSASTVMCAAKLAGVVATHGADSEAVLTFLRWARELEPLFFHNFNALVVEMKILPRTRHEDLQLPSSIIHFIEATSEHRASVLHHLLASQQQVREAFKRGVLHIQLPSRSQMKVAVGGWEKSISRPDEAMAYLCHELIVLHKDVFPHALAVYVTLAASILSASTEATALDAVTSAIHGILSVAAIRSDDSSLFLLLAAIIDLRVARHSMWQLKSQFFERTVEDLSEQFVLETDSTRKWTQQVLLFQLLVECDPSLLATRQHWLEDCLPSCVYRIVRNRFKS